ncbi:beta-N-acetylhexosaminidase [Candidatus Thiodiazotropha sp. CDECU1]|uniref:beta-N-acetylhexosaminidase n=1 Tax=Candidatus Thiodiazotropha sp. CDECU1 TaxID=3065865 RepID=UPI002930DD26|nr:beta-N-acetylhexosaminidase [Candidatus Thiodiazotropha sp. CDECU1]
MSLGPVMLDLEGTSVASDEERLLAHPAVGGVILFSRNYDSLGQLQALCDQIHSLRNPHLLIAVDQEGGRVQRFREGFTSLPPAAWYGEQYQNNTQQGLESAQLGGWVMAAELRACGVDFSFAPVLDIGFGISDVIGDRAFSSKPDIVARLAKAWMQGVHHAGMAVVGKHFPGHGGVTADSHLALPVDQRRFEDLEMEDLRPFENMIHAGMEAIMPAHVIYAHIDQQLAGFSSFWLQRVLRRQLGFQGVIFSDDLNMAAAQEAGGYGDRATAALSAGCDMVLVCNNRPAAIEILDRLKEYDDPAAHVRLVRMHGRKSQTMQQLHLDPQWRRAVNRLSMAPEEINLDLGLE